MTALKNATIETLVIIISSLVGIAICFGGLFISRIFPEILEDPVCILFIILGICAIRYVKIFLDKHLVKTFTEEGKP